MASGMAQAKGRCLQQLSLYLRVQQGAFPLSRLRAAGLAGHVGALGHHMLSLCTSLCLQNLLSVPFKFLLFLSWFLSLSPPANAEEG